MGVWYSHKLHWNIFPASVSTTEIFASSKLSCSSKTENINQIKLNSLFMICGVYEYELSERFLIYKDDSNVDRNKW